MLDSHGREEVGPGDVGGLYGARAPSRNAAKKPSEWQKFVIDFQAPRFAGETKIGNSVFRKVILNGKVIHENVVMQQQTPGGVVGAHLLKLRCWKKSKLARRASEGHKCKRPIRLRLTLVPLAGASG